MEVWKELMDKEIKIIFEDGENHFSKKQGLLIEVTTTHLIIKKNDKPEAFNLNKILRVEVIENGMG